MSAVQSYEVSVRFSDGDIAVFPVTSNETILEGALKADVPILNQCQSGSCGSCVAVLEDGEATPLATQAGCLLDSELAEGRRLLCSARASSDCSFQVDYTTSAGAATPAAANVFIDEIAWLSSDVVRLGVELAEGDWADFSPGQYMRINIPNTEISRSYSMSSSPEQLPKLEFLVRVIPGGLFSEFLSTKARVDDILKLEGPYGSFFWRENFRRSKHLLIAGGTGLAPILSILDQIRAAPGKKPNITLSFGCASDKTFFGADILDLRKAWMPTLETRLTVDDAGESWSGLIGNPLQAISTDDIESDAVAYVCGPPGLVNSSKKVLSDFGMSESRIFAERFLPE